MSRRESVKYSLQYVLSALDALGIDEEDQDEVIVPERSPSVNLLPVITTLKAIGGISDFSSGRNAQPAPYNLDLILQALNSFGQKDPEDDEWDYTLTKALSTAQLNAKHDIEDIITSITAFERSNSKHDLQLLLTETEAQNRCHTTASGKDFDLQFVLMSLEALGEDESETETFLQSLNPTRKNTLVKCNLQYVLSALDGLGELEDVEESKGESKGESKSESKYPDYYSESSKHNSSRRHNKSNSSTPTKKNIFDENEKNFASIMGNISSGYEPGSDSGHGAGRYTKSLRSLSEGEEQKEREADDFYTANRSNKFRK